MESKSTDRTHPIDPARVKELRRKQGWSQGKLAREAGVTVKTISDYESGKRKPYGGSLESLAAALGVTPADLLSAGAAPSSVEELIGQITAEREQMLPAVQRIEGLSRDLLASLDDKHFFISTTTAVRNWVWYTSKELEDKPGKDLVPGRVRSIRAGGLFLMLVPKPTMFRGLLEVLGREAILKDYSDITGGYQTFCARAVEQLGGDPGAAARTFHRHQQMLAIDKFPFTGAGWTVNLFGRKAAKGQSPKFAMIHGPYARGLALQLWSDGDHFFPKWLWNWMVSIVRTEAGRHRGTGTDKSIFYDELLRRMGVESD